MTKQLSECGKSVARQCAFCSTLAMATSRFAEVPGADHMQGRLAAGLIERAGTTPCRQWPPRPATVPKTAP